MGNQFGLFGLLLSAFILTTSVGCGEDRSPQDPVTQEIAVSSSELTTSVSRSNPPAKSANTQDIIFKQRIVRNASNEVISDEELIPADEELKYWAINPIVTLRRAPEMLRHEGFEARELPDGTIEQIRTLRTAPDIQNFQPHVRLSAPLRTEGDAVARATAAPEQNTPLSLKVRDIPRWNIPPSPKGRGLSSTLEAELSEVRRAAIENRKNVISQAMQPVVASVKALGGRVLRTQPLIGWLTVEVKGKHLSTLQQRADLAKIGSARTIFPEDNACDPFCNQPSTNWPMGDGRGLVRTGVDFFLNDNFDGSRSNPGMHNFGRLNAAIMEKAGESSWEDEALFLENGNGTDRISVQKKCSGGNCTVDNNFNDSDGYDHPISVASILAGDLTEGQADSNSFGDACYTSGAHCPSWEDDTTGMAPEANVQLWASVGDPERDDAILDAVFGNSGDDTPDVINLSTSRRLGECNANSSWADEDAIESAYQEGVFVVNGPGNLGLSSGCNLDRPGDTPTAFTVNPFNAQDSNCIGYGYGDCPLISGAQGGMDLLIGGINRTGVMSGFDLIAPSNVNYFGRDLTNVGSTDDTNTFGGTSAAAPHVAGAAIAFKDWALWAGNTYVNNPGRLFAMMLAMGDRDQGGTSGVAAGFNDTHGGGKLKMRFFDSGGFLSPWGYSMKTDSSSTVTTHTITPFSSPMPSGVEQVKCVMQEDEYFASKTDASDVALEVEIVPPNNGSCFGTSVPSYDDRDWSYDLKHLVSIEDSDTTLAGQCVKLNVSYFEISSAGSATVHAFCYYAAEKDYEP